MFCSWMRVQSICIQISDIASFGMKGLRLTSRYVHKKGIIMVEVMMWACIRINAHLVLFML
ncbi:hypothetical protein X975_21260, partial [Stegodyphus mimosarum]